MAPAPRTADPAVRPPSGPAPGEPYPWALVLVRHFDLALLALALPVFLIAGLPVLGWVAAAVAWVSQRVIRHVLDQRARATDDPRTVAGITAGSMLLRGWLMALTIFGVGLTDREAGLSGAVLVILLFTAFFSVHLALRPFDTRRSA